MIRIPRWLQLGCFAIESFGSTYTAINSRIQKNVSGTLERSGEIVRSEVIFLANAKIENRFRLCQTASKYTRRLIVSAGDAQETINKAFVSIATDSSDEVLAGAELR